MVEAFLFAIIAAILLELFLHPFRKLYGKYIATRIRRLSRKLRNRGRKLIHPTEIRKSIATSSPQDVPVQMIADLIENNEALFAVPGTHWRNVPNTYHISRRLKVFPLLNGSESIIEHMCSHLCAGIDFSQVDLILCLRKDYNLQFSQKLKKHYKPLIKAHHLVHEEGLTFAPKFAYEEAESLEGVKVLFLEALHLFPEKLTESINWLRSQGAEVCKVVILFNGSNKSIDATSLGLASRDVLTAASVDLDLHETAACAGPAGTKLKVITYSEY